MNHSLSCCLWPLRAFCCVDVLLQLATCYTLLRYHYCSAPCQTLFNVQRSLLAMPSLHPYLHCGQKQSRINKVRLMQSLVSRVFPTDDHDDDCDDRDDHDDHDDMSDALRSLRRERESEEAQPLLAHSRGESHASARSVEQTPLPMIQLLVLCVMRLSEPMVFTSILPFIAQMLHENMPQVPKRELGYYAGLIESVFALVQVGCVFFWGRASDSFGRKPVLLIGLVGTFVSVNAFGLAKTLPQMILARSLAGVMNGNVAVIKVRRGSRQC